MISKLTAAFAVALFIISANPVSAADQDSSQPPSPFTILQVSQSPTPEIASTVSDIQRLNEILSTGTSPSPSPGRIPASTSILKRLRHLSPGTICPTGSDKRMAPIATGSEAINAIVVGSALSHGAKIVTAFAGGPIALFAEQIIESYAIRTLTRHASCKTHNVINAALTASALLNASQSGVSK